MAENCPRDLNKIIAFLVKEVIPKSEDALLVKLNDLTHQTAYLPPELQTEYWGDLCRIMASAGAIDTPWKERARDIINDLEKLPNEYR